ncbi:transposase, partial [Shigella dysenteriae]
STLKSPSYTKSVSWQHYPVHPLLSDFPFFIPIYHANYQHISI